MKREDGQSDFFYSCLGHDTNDPFPSSESPSRLLTYVPCAVPARGGSPRAVATEARWPRATPSSQQGSRSSGNSASSWWHGADFRAFLRVRSDVWKSLRDNQPAWQRAPQAHVFLEEAAVPSCEARCFRAQLASDARQVAATGTARLRTCPQCPSTAKTPLQDSATQKDRKKKNNTCDN